MAAVLLASFPGCTGTATASGAPCSAALRPLQRTGDNAWQKWANHSVWRGLLFGGCVNTGTPTALSWQDATGGSPAHCEGVGSARSPE